VVNPPLFSASVVKVTAEGEQLQIAVTAESMDELGTKIAAACEIADRRMVEMNERVLAPSIEERAQQLLEERAAGDAGPNGTTHQA